MSLPHPESNSSGECRGPVYGYLELQSYCYVRPVFGFNVKSLAAFSGNETFFPVGQLSALILSILWGFMTLYYLYYRNGVLVILFKAMFNKGNDFTLYYISDDGGVGKRNS